MHDMDSAIRCRHLKKTYDGKVEAVRGLDLEIQPGECFGLLGPNGAGKTTTIEILEGLLEPTSGEVEILGMTWPGHERELREWLGISLQETRLSEKLTVRETIELFASFYHHPASVDNVLEEMSLTEKSSARVGTLSGGQRQRVLFAISICGDPDLLFLDEPTVGLDVEARRLMWTQIRALVARGKTVLLTTHYLNEADALADRILVLQHGSIVAEGTSAEIKARAIGKQVRFTSRLTPEEIRGIAGVLSVTSDRQKHELQVQAAEPVVRELLNRDSWLTDLEVTSAGLEEAFLALTQNHNSNGSN